MNDALKGLKILILIPGHLASAPRAQKEALALRAASAQVLIHGVWWNHVLADEDLALGREMDVHFAPVADLRGGAQGNFMLRTKQRLARECFTRLGLVTSRTFGNATPEFLREARRIKADLTMVHSEAGLWVGKKLLDDGYRVGVDFDDWFSHDLLPEDRVGRPVASLIALEQYMLQYAYFCLTTSRVLAEALARDAGVARVPSVVPNCFPAAARDSALAGPHDAKLDGVVSFYWFSQTIGPGRGLETLAEALSQLKGPWQVTLRGALHHHRGWFDKTFSESLRSRLDLLDPVPNEELLARTMSHDVGLALEVPYCRNKNLTASNKLFEYLRAGLAVIATRTKGQEEVMRSCPGAGSLIAPNDPVALATAMQKMIDEVAYLRNCKHASWEAGRSVWSWETHEPRLLKAIATGLARPLS